MEELDPCKTISFGTRQVSASEIEDRLTQLDLQKAYMKDKITDKINFLEGCSKTKLDTNFNFPSVCQS